MVPVKSEKRRGSADSIGERLRKAREDKGVSVGEAHKITKIHPSVIKALEEDELEHTLGKTYVKAFLKNYANYLGLDAEEILQEYISKHPPETEIQKGQPVLGKKPISQKKNIRFSHTMIVTLAFIVWLSILSFATVKFIHYYKEVVMTKKTGLKGIFAKKAQEISSNKSSSLAKGGKKELIPIPKHQTITLTIFTYKDVWLKVTQDGTVAFHGTLSKNSKETWRANKKIVLSEIGKPEMLALNVNGKDIDFLGKRLGKNVLITHEGIDLEPKL